MKQGWNLTTWGTIATLEYGRALRGYASSNGKVRVYGTNGPIGWTDNSICDSEGVIIGRKGAYRGVHFSAEPFFVIDTAYYLKPKLKIDLRWAYYQLTGQDINSLDSGSAIPSTSRNDFYSLPVTLPPLSEQRAIADILGSLDDKIELNRRMNATLEAMARALFKSWFVDFDPVRAKMDGRAPAGMDAATAALFPARLVDSELGPIPEGWRVESVYAIANVIYGAPFASSEFNSTRNGYPLIRIRDLVDQAPSVFTTEIHPKGRLITPGEIIVGMDGEFRAYLWGGPASYLNQRLCVFEPTAASCTAYVWNAISAPLARVEATETATTVIHLGKNDIDRFRVVVPDALVMKAYRGISEPILSRYVQNRSELRTLANVRDTLLPKLLSGELAVDG